MFYAIDFFKNTINHSKKDFKKGDKNETQKTLYVGLFLM
jgi:hypothetical protein